jgi:hypothetical protein
VKNSSEDAALASPQFLVGVVAGLQVPFVCNETNEIGENSLVPICNEFVFTTGSHPTITTAPVSQRSIYKVKRIVYLSDRSNFEP